MLALSPRRAFRPLLRLVLACLLTGIIFPPASTMPVTVAQVAPQAAASPVAAASAPRSSQVPTPVVATPQRSNPATVQTPNWVANPKFTTGATALASGLLNADFSQGPTVLATSSYPTNYNFSTGDLTGWTPSDANQMSVVNDSSSIAGPYLEMLGAWQSVMSSAFTVPATAQSLQFDYFNWTNTSANGVPPLSVYVLSGPSFATSQFLGEFSGSQNQGWQHASVDLQAFQGQAVKVRFDNSSGNGHFRLDNISLQEDVPAWKPSNSGSMRIANDSNSIAGPYLQMFGAWQSVMSSSFGVPATAQSLQFDYFNWTAANANTGTPLSVYILSGPSFATSQFLGEFSGSQNQGWLHGSVDLQAFQGQTVKVRFDNNSSSGNFRLDNISTQVDVPAWTSSSVSQVTIHNTPFFPQTTALAPQNPLFSTGPQILATSAYPLNYNFAQGSVNLASSSYPSNYNFSTGDLTGWTASDANQVSVVDDSASTAGPYMQVLGQYQFATSSAFTVPTTTQSLHFDFFKWLPNNSAYGTYMFVYILSGPDFSVSTRFEFTGAEDQGWQSSLIDMQTFQGQTVKVRFFSDNGNMRIDNISLRTDVPDWTPSAASQVSVVNDSASTAGPYMQVVGPYQFATSSAFMVLTTTQSLHFDYFKWLPNNPAYGTYMFVYILSGPNFSVSTRFDFVGAENQGWQSSLIDMQTFQGQTVKVRFYTDTGNMRVDNLSLQTDVPGWTSSVASQVSIIDDSASTAGPYVQVLGPYQSVTSSAFVVPDTADSLHFDYFKWLPNNSAYGTYMFVYILSGPNFSISTRFDFVGAENQGWQSTIVDMQAWQGQAVKLQFFTDTGNMRVDNITMTTGPVRRTPLWDYVPPNQYLQIDGGSQWAVSQAFTVITASDQLRFDYLTWGSGHIAAAPWIYVDALTGANFATAVRVGVVNGMAQQGWHGRTALSLTAFDGQAIKLRFYLDGGWNVHARIDNIVGPADIPNDQVVVIEQCACHDPANALQLAVARPINTRSGALWTSTTDLSVAGSGPALAWTRTYLSPATDVLTNPLGVGWQQPFATRVITSSMLGGEPGRLIIVSPKGNRLRFQDHGGGQFEAFPGVFSTLTQVGTTYVQTFPTKEQTIFDATGRAIAQKDAQGRQLDLTYQADRLVRVEDASDAQRFLAVSYDVTHTQIVQVSDGAGRAVTYDYSSAGDLNHAYDVMSRPTTYHYSNHMLTEVDNALGQPIEQTTYDSYTPAGKAIRQVQQDGQVIELAYGSAATIVTTTGLDGKRNVATYSYDDSNTIASIALNGTVLRETSVDGQATPARTADANGNATTTRYTALGQPQRITDALGAVTQVSYDSQQRPTTVTDSQGRQSVSVYDSNNNLIRQTTGITTSYPLGFTTIYTYNVRYPGQNWLEDQRGPDGVVSRYDYDTHGQLTAATVGYGTSLAQTTTYAFDTIGRVTSSTSGYGTALARTDTTSYNADNTIASTTQNYKNGVFDPAHPDEDIVTTYGYDGLGRQVWVRDLLGHYDVTHYNAAGRVDWSARNFQASGWSGGALPATPPAYSAASPDRNVATLYGYDGLGRTTLVTQTGLLNGSFNPSTLQFSAATTRVTRTEYDQLSRPITTTLNYRPSQPASADTNVQTMTTYDNAGNVIWQRDALGRWSKTDYDALNQPVKTIANYDDGDPLTGAGDTDSVSVMRYDAAGQLERQIDNYVDGTFTATEPITDRVTLPHYDTLGRVTSTTQNAAAGASDTALNRVSMTAYDPVTMRTQGQRDALGRWVSQQYDLLGRVTSTIQNCTGTLAPQSCGSATVDRNVASQTRYDALGRAFETVDALGVVTHTTFDGLGRATATTRNYVSGAATTAITNVTTLTSYDALGRRIASTDALGHTSTTGYNGLSQTTVMTDTAGRVMRMGYDGNGTLRWTKRNDSQLTLYQLDGLGRTIATIINYQDGTVGGSEPVDQDLISRTSYDVAGRRTQTTDAAGRVTAFAYDNQDRLIAVTENAVTGTCVLSPCNVITQYQYDRAGNRTAIIDANGHTRSFSYDAANQQSTATDALGQTTSWDYDAGGRVTTQHDPRGSSYDLTYHYSGLDQITQTLSLNLPTAIGAQYDVLGRRTQLVDATGTTSFHYNPLGQIIQVQAPNTGMIGYGYDARGLRTVLTYPDSTSVQYDYTADGQLHTVTQGATTLASYDYDTAGRLHTVTRANGATTTSTYDAADRLRELRTTVGGSDISRFQYSVDRLGQRTNATETLSTTRTISYTYDGLQRLSGATEAPGTTYSYAYDDAGNRTGVWLNGTRTVTQTFNAANQVNGFTYDAAGNLTSDGTTMYGYDALNRMTARGGTTYSYNGDGVLVDDGTTRYAQDLASPLSQVLQSTQGSATTKYLYGLDRLAAQTSSMRTWYGTDALGSVRQTISDMGLPLSVVNYDPWGTVEGGSVPVFGFTGELQDAASGMVNLRARWYSAGQGRFNAVDPFPGWATEPASLRPYQYANNNPARYTDPSGRCTVVDDRVKDIGNLDCTLKDFAQFSAQTRLNWVDDFSQGAGVKGWFNNVKDIITFFSESCTLHNLAPNSWASWSDAAVLQVIQDGYVLFSRKVPVNPVGTPSRLWRSFFAEHDRTPFDVPRLKPFWGKAEQAGVDYGIRIADAYARGRRGRPGGVEGTLIQDFVESSNIYRAITSKIGGGGAAGCRVAMKLLRLIKNPYADSSKPPYPADLDDGTSLPACIVGSEVGEWFVTPRSQVPGTDHGPTYFSGKFIESASLNGLRPQDILAEVLK